MADTSREVGEPRRRGRLLAFVVGGVLLAVVGAGAFVYFVLLPTDSPAPLRLTPHTGARAPASSLAGTWAATTDGVAGYRVREKLAFLPAQSDAVGRTASVNGSFTIVPDGRALVATDVAIEVDVSTLKSADDRRDNAIRGQGLETSRFPTATFEATAPITIPDGASDGKAVQVTARGSLTIHGVTKTVEIEINAHTSGSIIELQGSYSFPFAMFDIEPPNRAGFVTVEDHGTMEFKLKFQKTA